MSELKNLTVDELEREINGMVDPSASSDPVDWERFVPAERLPDTGCKRREVGEVWAVCVSNGYGSVVRIVAVRSDGYGVSESEWMAGADVCFVPSRNSDNDRYSVLVRHADGTWADGYGPDGPAASKAELAVAPGLDGIREIITKLNWTPFLPTDEDCIDEKVAVDFPVGSVVAVSGFRTKGVAAHWVAMVTRTDFFIECDVLAKSLDEHIVDPRKSKISMARGELHRARLVLSPTGEWGPGYGPTGKLEKAEDAASAEAGQAATVVDWDAMIPKEQLPDRDTPSASVSPAEAVDQPAKEPADDLSGVDWDCFIPPAPLEDTGPANEWEVGDVLAFHRLDGREGVFRIESDEGHYHTLAGDSPTTGTVITLGHDSVIRATFVRTDGEWNDGFDKGGMTESWADLLQVDPCPFCGEEEDFDRSPPYVGCNNCGAVGPDINNDNVGRDFGCDDGASAVVAWNRRAGK